MPTYADGPWTAANTSVPPYVVPPPAFSDGPWAGVNANIEAPIPVGDGPWTGVNFALDPADAAHRPVIVKRAGVLTRIRILTLSDFT